MGRIWESLVILSLSAPGSVSYLIACSVCLRNNTRGTYRLLSKSIYFQVVKDSAIELYIRIHMIGKMYRPAVRTQVPVVSSVTAGILDHSCNRASFHWNC